MKVKTDTHFPLPGKCKAVWHGQKSCKGERGSLLVLVAVVSTAPSWLLLALQLLIIRVGLGVAGVCRWVKCWGQN